MSIRSMLLKANHAVVVESPVAMQSALGGYSAGGFARTATLQPVWVQPAKDETKFQYLRRRLAVTHTVYLDQDPAAIGLTIDCRLRFEGTRLLKVRGFRNAGELGRFWAIDCEE